MFNPFPISTQSDRCWNLSNMFFFDQTAFLAARNNAKQSDDNKGKITFHLFAGLLPRYKTGCSTFAKYKRDMFPLVLATIGWNNLSIFHDQYPVVSPIYPQSTQQFVAYLWSSNIAMESDPDKNR